MTGSDRHRVAMVAGSFARELANAERSEAGKGGLGGNPAPAVKFARPRGMTERGGRGPKSLKNHCFFKVFVHRGFHGGGWRKDGSRWP